jgi:glycosyltransferase involved in cell wall biosynthesis
MRILYFSRDYTTHDRRFLQELAKTEHKVYFLQLERRGHTLEDRPLPVEIEQIHWAGGRAPARLRDGPRLLPDLKRVIRQVKPDLIQAGPIQRAAFLAALTGFHPLLSMSWGYDLLVDANRNAAWRWATRFTLKHSDAMVGDCQTIRQLAVAHGMPDERIVTFPWGIDLEHFAPLPPSPAQEQDENAGSSRPFVILSTRGWESIYGVDIIARAFVTAARQCAELQLIMLGNGSLATTLRRMFAKGNVEEQVVFPGQVKYSELPRYYQRADLYVSASHSDGSSISLLEAMACGKPVLVSDIPGNREWVTPYTPLSPESSFARSPSPLKGKGENAENLGVLGGKVVQNTQISELSPPSRPSFWAEKGGDAAELCSGDERDGVGWLFTDGDADALAQAILHAVEQRRRLPEMGCRARALAEQRADWSKNFPYLFKAYDIALSRSN